LKFCASVIDGFPTERVLMMILKSFLLTLNDVEKE